MFPNQLWAVSMFLLVLWQKTWPSNISTSCTIKNWRETLFSWPTCNHGPPTKHLSSALKDTTSTIEASWSKVNAKVHRPEGWLFHRWGWRCWHLQLCWGLRKYELSPRICRNHVWQSTRKQIDSKPCDSTTSYIAMFKAETNRFFLKEGRVVSPDVCYYWSYHN